MAWKAISAFMNSQKGKYIRFVKPWSGKNMSHAFGIKSTNAASIRIDAGAVGKIYEVRGATMFIGFSNDLKTPPPAYMSPTSFGATIQLYINDIDKVQVDE